MPRADRVLAGVAAVVSFLGVPGFLGVGLGVGIRVGFGGGVRLLRWWWRQRGRFDWVVLVVVGGGGRASRYLGPVVVVGAGVAPGREGLVRRPFSGAAVPTDEIAW